MVAGGLEFAPLQYLGFVGLMLAIAIGVHRFETPIVAQLARKTGLSGWRGWLVTIGAAAWLFLPVLFGAPTDAELWAVGTGFSGVGFFLILVAVGSRDEYRLLTSHPYREPTGVSPQEEVVVTSGQPTAVRTRSDAAAAATDALADVEDGDPPPAPFSGVPTVHTDWLVQRPTEVAGIRGRGWRTVAGGVVDTSFALGDGAVQVGDTHRVVSGEEQRLTVDADETLPDAARAFFAAHEELPAPDDRDSRLRLFETNVPADRPVTVIGRPTQAAEPGQVRIETAPPDDLFGPHPARQPVPEEAVADGGETDADGFEWQDHVGDEGDPVLITGDADEAERLLHKRVYWVGAAGGVMLLGGQALAFALAGLLPG